MHSVIGHIYTQCQRLLILPLAAGHLPEAFGKFKVTEGECVYYHFSVRVFDF